MRAVLVEIELSVQPELGHQHAHVVLDVGHTEPQATALLVTYLATMVIWCRWQVVSRTDEAVQREKGTTISHSV